MAARILIIDDEDQIRTMLRQLLEHEGYEVMEAPDGREGIKTYRSKPADLIITDIVMPEKEGIETIMELKQDYPDVKIIAMSGGGRIEPETYLKMAKNFGALLTFTKPIQTRQLLNAVKGLLN
jgi:DNA-binding response OmpR family regulator